MDSTALARELGPQFERDGFLLIRGFYSSRETAELNARFERLIKENVPGYPATDAFYEVKGQPQTLKYLPRLARHEPFFDKMQTDPRFQKLAEGLLGDTAVPQGIEWFNKCSRVGRETPPHQDGWYYMLTPNEGVHYWLALDEVDEANGCIRYIPGSHRTGMRDHARSDLLGFSQFIPDYGPADRAAERCMVMKPGDLLVHHTMTVHRADANTSGRERRAMGVIYFAGRAKIDHQKREAYQAKLNKQLAEQGKI